MSKRQNMLPFMVPGYIPNILILGNGINLGDWAEKKDSWDDLIRDMADESYKGKMEEIKERGVPYPLRPVIVTGDHIDVRLEDKAASLMPHGLGPKHSDFIRMFTDLPFDAILTTNYTYEIEQAILPGFSCAFKRTSKYRKTSYDGRKPEEQFGIYKYFCLPEKNRSSFVWHIHGEAARPNSMVLGHYYYGNLLSVIQQHISTILSRLSICEKRNIPFQPKSWIDYFMLGNVYIAGFGMDFAEMDIWWMVNCKVRRFAEHGKIVFYEPKCKDADNRLKCELAKAYRMEMPDLGFDEDYLKYYRNVVKDIRKRMDIRN